MIQILKYQKRPEIVEAVQVTEFNKDDIKDWLYSKCSRLVAIYNAGEIQRANIGNWVVLDCNDEVDIFEPDEFNKIYKSFKEEPQCQA